MQLVLLCLVVLSGVSAQGILNLGLNEKCKNGTEPWTCKVSKTCKGLNNAIQNGGIKLCSFHGGEPVICCPPESQASQISDKVALLPLSDPEGGKKAEKKCREYAEYVYRIIPSPILLPNSKKKKVADCAVAAETLIVGGVDAKANEFPHMALIGIESKTSPLWFCGGSLISPDFVLTAAHCEISTKILNNASIVVRLGELDLLKKKDKDAPINVKIAQVFDHPKYVHGKNYHDITLLKLEKEVELSPTIRPLCLQINRSFVKDIKAIASGWGFTSYGNGTSSSSNILQKVQLKIIDDDECVGVYGNKWHKVSKGVKPEIMMCSGGERGKDTCQGDSGGPLQIPLKDPYCMYSQIGITSFGIGCGFNTPGIYTRISAYVPWIENIVWP